ncbi:MAG: leucine-rich repeat domain-containing protein, partial [Bacilli bacterium]|nr:leucine-rich repeat domain-containing protein [Bacilli bacterium]MBP3921210.1 leucine-rich repeat domain-containing protein [Bacilli bacterium]
MKNKKKILLGLIPVIIIGIILYTKPVIKNITIEANTYKTPANSAFKDENFYKCVVDNYNQQNNTSIGYDVSLTDEQLETITSVKCDGTDKESNERINNTSGLEKLTSITNLELYANQISSINLSKNIILKNLELSFNQLTGIDLSKNTSLTSLYLSNNQLTNIDLSKNTSLRHVSIYWNQLTNIDLSQNTNLTELNLSDNQITDIDLSHNTDLTSLRLRNNKLTNIDLSKNTKLRELGLGQNQLTNIDLSKNSSITNLWLDYNQLTDVDVSQNTNLTKLSLHSNQLTSIDINKNTNLTQLYLDSNQLASVDLSQNTNLTDLSIGSNLLTSIDLSKNTNLIYLELSNNQLTRIDLNKKTNLTHLYLDSNQLASVDLSQNTNLTKLSIGSNLLTSIDLSKNTNLTELSLGNNQLTNIDLSKNTNLTHLNLSNNELTNINLSNNKNLTFKNISNQHKKYIIYKNDLSKISEQELINEIRNDTSKTNFTIVYTYIDMDDSEDVYNFDYYITWIEAMSDKYIIDENNNYIYTGTDIADRTILQNINLTEYDGITGTIENNKYIIKYNDEVLKEFDLINIFSNKYDLSKQYLIGEIANIINNIIVMNGKAEFNLLKNKIEIKHNDDVLQEFDYINYTSNKYDLNSDYIKVNDNNIESFLNNINCTNCNAYVYDGTNTLTTGEFKDNYKLRIMHNDDIIKEYEIK